MSLWLKYVWVLRATGHVDAKWIRGNITTVLFDSSFQNDSLDVTNLAHKYENSV
jgi:hypothetical protein